MKKLKSFILLTFLVLVGTSGFFPHMTLGCERNHKTLLECLNFTWKEVEHYFCHLDNLTKMVEDRYQAKLAELNPDHNPLDEERVARLKQLKAQYDLNRLDEFQNEKIRIIESLVNLIESLDLQQKQYILNSLPYNLLQEVYSELGSRNADFNEIAQGLNKILEDKYNWLLVTIQDGDQVIHGVELNIKELWLKKRIQLITNISKFFGPNSFLNVSSFDENDKIILKLSEIEDRLGPILREMKQAKRVVEFLQSKLNFLNWTVQYKNRSVGFSLESSIVPEKVFETKQQAQDFIKEINQLLPSFGYYFEIYPCNHKPGFEIFGHLGLLYHACKAPKLNSPARSPELPFIKKDKHLSPIPLPSSYIDFTLQALMRR